MIIKKLEWISAQAKEAELLVSDGNYECVVFSQPCNFRLGDEIEGPLHAFITEDLMVSYKDGYSIQLISPESLSYKCAAKVVDIENNLVKIGKIFIILDQMLPVGCSKGVFVEFSCVRLDY